MAMMKSTEFTNLNYIQINHPIRTTQTNREMTIAQKFNHDFDNGVFRLFDSNGNLIYLEDSKGSWYKYEYDSNGNQTYYETSKGEIIDKRPTSPCNGKIVEIDGKKYQLKELNQ